MNNLQEITTILAPITGLVIAIAILFESILRVAKSFTKLRQLIATLEPSVKLLLKYLIMVTVHIIPIGCVIWYFMYLAAIYSDRLMEKSFFLLIVIYPTFLISFYEILLGIRVNTKPSFSSNPVTPSFDKKNQKNRR